MNTPKRIELIARESRHGGWFLQWADTGRCAGGEMRHATEDVAREYAEKRFPGANVVAVRAERSAFPRVTL